MMEDRVRTLEERVAWLEHHLAEARELVDAAFTRMGALEAEVKRIREEAREPGEDPPDWEVPPHY